MRRTLDHLRIDALQTPSLDGTSFRTFVNMHEPRPAVLAKVTLFSTAFWRDVTEYPDLVGVVPAQIACRSR